MEVVPSLQISCRGVSGSVSIVNDFEPTLSLNPVNYV